VIHNKVNHILKRAKEVLQIEAEGILGVVNRLTPSFAQAVKTILKAEGRVIITGVGKSGIVGRKIVATLNSTGTPALFLHPVEAMHGDLGMVTKKDVILAISNSGETGEITILIPSFKRLKAPLIAFTENTESTLARYSDVVINTGVKREACPLGLVPTASTTAVLAMGDALAVVLLEERQFSPDDFRRFHPGGNLGKRLSFEVEKNMYRSEELSKVGAKTKLKNILHTIAENDILWVVTRGRLKGIIDTKAMVKLLTRKDEVEMYVKDLLRPIETINSRTPVSEALNKMREKEIDALGVVDKKGHFIGAVFLKDLLKKATFSFFQE
jgi:arabinose-5-phosphate isomerase